MFTLKIKTDNAAFQEDCSGEIARILRDTAERLDLYGHGNFALHDANGNTVGATSYTRK